MAVRRLNMTVANLDPFWTRTSTRKKRVGPNSVEDPNHNSRFGSIDNRTAILGTGRFGPCPDPFLEGRTHW